MPEVSHFKQSLTYLYSQFRRYPVASLPPLLWQKWLGSQSTSAALPKRGRKTVLAMQQEIFNLHIREKHLCNITFLSYTATLSQAPFADLTSKAPMLAALSHQAKCNLIHFHSCFCAYNWAKATLPAQLSLIALNKTSSRFPRETQVLRLALLSHLGVI